MTARGTPGPTCGAKTTTGGTCKKPPLKGATRCKNHGGKSPRAQAAAQDRLEQAAAERALARIGVTIREINPADALLELVHYQASIVDFWRQRVSEVADADLTWGVTRVKEGGDDRGTTQEAKPHIAYVLLVQAQDKLADYCTQALKAGVEERRVRLAESQGALAAQAIRNILDALHLTAEQLELVPTVVPAQLRLIAGGGA
jgi:hypothetical protein